MASFKKENAKVLLGIAENRRQHLANAIDVSMGLAATLCFGIISFFFKAFIDNTGALNSSKTDAQTYAFSYVIFGFGLSSLILTIWRNYAQYLDQKIAQLYPEILDYEIQLGVSQNAGLRGILSDSKLIKKEIAARAPQKQLNLIKELVKRNRIGWRGHKTFEWIVIIFIGLSIVIAFLYFWILRHNPVIDKDYFKMATTWDLDTLRQYPLLLANYSGWVLIFFASVMQTLVWIKHQKNADGRTVSKIVNYEKETR